MQTHHQKKSSNPQRLPFRTSCDPCAASKARCTKEKHGCSRCVLNGSKCVYGRSRRKGKPSSKTTTELAHSPLHPPSSRVRMSFPVASAPLSLLALSALPTLPNHQTFWSMGPNHHQPNYNYNSTWYRSPTLPTTNYPTPTVWERRASDKLPPNMTPYQSPPDEIAGIPHLPDPGYSIWPSMVRPGPVVTDGNNLSSHLETSNQNRNGQNRGEEVRQAPGNDQHEPCIEVAVSDALLAVRIRAI